jgi:hypothetical protein
MSDQKPGTERDRKLNELCEHIDHVLEECEIGKGERSAAAA